MSPIPRIAVIIPALNEEQAIGKVIQSIPRQLVSDIIVVDNGSSDNTAQVAGASGAQVVYESRRGYGNACLAGISHLPQSIGIVVFMDGDYSDHPGEISRLLEPLLEGGVDLALGSRVLGLSEKGSLTRQQRFGNWLSTWLIWRLQGFRYTDLGPFRAINFEALRRLNMEDRTYGWTVEMQVKALQRGLRVTEVPVSYRKRIGRSKVSGTLSGCVMAGFKILWTIARLTVLARRD